MIIELHTNCRLVGGRYWGIMGLALGVLGVCPVLACAQTVSTFDVLVATETLTVVGTTTFRGNGFSVGGSALVVSSMAVSIGTITAPSQLSVTASTSAPAPTVYTSAGESIFMVPAGVTQIFIKAWGGGGGTGATQSLVVGGTGAGGSFAEGYLSVTPGQVLTIYVGGGGSAQTESAAGGVGLSTTSGGPGGPGRRPELCGISFSVTSGSGLDSTLSQPPHAMAKA